MRSVNQRLKSLPKKQLSFIGKEIPNLFKGQMESVVVFYVEKYSPILQELLGYTREDVRQEIRIVFWRGLVTFNPKKSKLKTYLCNLLRKHFSKLLRRGNAKTRAKLIPVEKFSNAQIEHDPLDKESWLLYLEQFQEIVKTLDGQESSVLKWHLLGKNIEGICHSTRIDRPAVIKHLKAIKKKMEALRKDNQ